MLAPVFVIAAAAAAKHSRSQSLPAMRDQQLGSHHHHYNTYTHTYTFTQFIHPTVTTAILYAHDVKLNRLNCCSFTASPSSPAQQPAPVGVIVASKQLTVMGRAQA
ncbi:hypothetical protein E2C01_014136 [Portunus trituberculatus]|uniref:Uncharacterized protein n=1 Tax=Portunus trituberculatus TaxID=210409 RepID=A0A5B7DID9_PORTR|nr:hypothetical protein [Portunus trituberculatus]